MLGAVNCQSMEGRGGMNGTVTNICLAVYRLKIALTVLFWFFFRTPKGREYSTLQWENCLRQVKRFSPDSLQPLCN